MRIVTIDVFLSDTEVDSFMSRLDWPEDAGNEAAGRMVQRALDSQGYADTVIVSVEHRQP